MSSWVKPGVKCVCIDGGSPRSRGFELFGQFPVTGGIHTVDSVFLSATDPGKTLLRLSELKVDLRYGWDAARFRPLVTRTQEQDLEHFLTILNTVEEPA